MSYTKTSGKSSQKYIKDKQQSILLRIKKTEYEQYIKPAIERSGLPVATFIKQAINEKIERDISSES